MEDMKRFVCKTCGAELGELFAKAEKGVVKCPYCDSVWTVSKKQTSVEAVNYIAIGEHELDVCRFEEAYSAFKKAAELCPEEPQAFWGMALAEFKVQYLKDYVNNRMQPICHEINEKSFSKNKNYYAALQLATPEQKSVYKAKSEEIDEINDEFYRLKETGLDYDCFICVKVTDDNGGKTKDYERAFKIYYNLLEKGFKPFFSEIVLKGATGSDYEAHILYALSKSETMLVVCENEEYLKTPWVKNEYTRFTAMIADEKKENDALTVVFSGKPIERLPGRRGKLQGIDFDGFDASERIREFVEEHSPQAKKRKEEEAQKALKDKEESERKLKEFQEQERLKREQEQEALRKKFEELQRQLAENAVQKDAPPPAPEETKKPSEKDLLAKAKVLCLRRKFDEAIKIYEEITDENYDCLGAYIGILRAHSKNFTVFEGEDIQADIDVINGVFGETVEDEEFNAYIARRADEEKKKLAEKEQERAAEQKRLEEQRRLEEDKKRAEEEERKRKELEKNGVGKTVKAGDVITLGTYPQGEYGQIKPIEWQVLKVENGQALVMSKYALDCKRFNESLRDVTWDTCSLRKWLNVEFYKKAFSEEDRKIIALSTVTADKNPSYGTPQGANTQDNVFLLSIKEAKKCFTDKKLRKCQGTDFCYKQGAENSSGSCCWWLRSSGYNGNFVSCVDNGGSIYEFGHHANKDGYAVRPAMWIIIGGEGEESSQGVPTETAQKTPAQTQGDKKTVKVGDTITLGTYPQGENGEVKPIEWQVLNVDNGQALVVSKYALDCKRFNESLTAVTWETCSLRKWLNDEFYKKAFSEGDRKIIALSTVTADKNPSYGTPQGANTQDNVFLLSIKEVNEYFANDNERKCHGTPYCYKQGAFKNSGNGCCWWWLRSSGDDSSCAAGVLTDGDVYDNGLGVYDGDDAVRPAMWIIIGGDSEESSQGVPTEKPAKAPTETAQINPAQTQGVEKTVKVGDTITLGTYPQGTNGEVKPIEWQVLKVENGQALVISKYSLDCKKFNDTFTNVTWETCSLRKWLNGEFYKKAFSDTDKHRIIKATVTADRDSGYSTPQGNNTQDNVFLLSIKEANEYFANDKARICKGTAYCFKQGVYKGSADCCWWWLRSFGYDGRHAAGVDTDGDFYNYGYCVDDDDNAVRPALKINL